MRCSQIFPFEIYNSWKVCMLSSNYIWQIQMRKCFCWYDIQVTEQNLNKVGRHIGSICNTGTHFRAASTFASSQWETSLQSNGVSHWLSANRESALHYMDDVFITIWIYIGWKIRGVLRQILIKCSLQYFAHDTMCKSLLRYHGKWWEYHKTKSQLNCVSEMGSGSLLSEFEYWFR